MKINTFVARVMSISVILKVNKVQHLPYSTQRPEVQS